jgi:putative transposase
MISLKPGNIVKFKDKEYIIEKILENGSQLMLKSPNNEIKIVPLSELIKEKEPETQKTFSSLDNIRDELLKEAQRRFEIIKPLLDDETRTKKAVKQRAEETETHTATIYRWIKEYKENGENLLALLPKRNNQGGRGRSRLNPQIEAIINFYIEKEYLNKQKISAKHLLLLINNELKKQNLPVISYATLLRRINEIDERFKYKKREGRTKFLNNLKPSGNSYEPQYPLEVIQIDHTPLDIQIVDETYRKPIGRPYITLAIDVATRMIYGFYLSLDAPSFYSVGQTIFMGISPKEPYLSSLNIEGIWPIQGLPTTIHTDNAAEFRGSNLEKFCSIFNINLMFRPKGQPFYGGHVEKAIRTLNTYIHRLPGSTFSNPEERGEYNSEKKAVFTLKELEKYITEWIVNIYHKSPHKGIGGKTPLQIFEEKISSKINESVVQKFYSDNLEKYKQQERRILNYVKWPILSTKNDSLRTKLEAEDIVFRLKNGADFASLANSFSEDPGNFIDPSSPRGGRLGWFSNGQMNPEFSKAAFSAKVGDIVGPVLTEFGYHIIRINDEKKGDGKNQINASHILLTIKPSDTTKDLIYDKARLFSLDAIENGFENQANIENLEILSSNEVVRESVFINDNDGPVRSAVNFAFKNEVGAISDLSLIHI